jgi:glycosyltransferase involved in cell wall biosynthesis
MRIVQAVGWYFPDSLGGTEMYVGGLAAALLRRGHEVLVAAPDPAHAHERRYTHGGVAVYRYPTPGSPSRAEARGLVSVRGAERFHRWLSDLSPDIVHIHTFVTGLGLAEVEAAHAAGARVIVTSHSASLGFLCERGTLLRDGVRLCDARVDAGTCAACALERRGVPTVAAGAVAGAGRRWPGTWPLPGRLGTMLALPRLIDERRQAQRRLFEIIDAFVVLSDFARQVLVANGAPPDRVRVNRLGVADRPGGWTRKPDASMATARRPVTVGYLGRAEAIKGLDDLVAAFRMLPADTRLRLYIVAASGSRDQHDALRALADSVRGDPRVRVADGVPPREVPHVLASFDVLCCPSRAVEGGPTVALEAHAVGTPVIGSDLPALSEIVRAPEAGALFPPGDRPALARVLADLASRPDMVDAWRSRLPAPRRFSAVVDEYLELYAS